MVIGNTVNNETKEEREFEMDLSARRGGALFVDFNPVVVSNSTLDWSKKLSAST
jgi:hypothetical protein